MVDRDARDRILRLLKQDFLTDNLHITLQRIRTKDRTVIAAREFIYTVYHDSIEERRSRILDCACVCDSYADFKQLEYSGLQDDLDWTQDEARGRWILFLQTDMEYRRGVKLFSWWTLLLIPVILPVLAATLVLAYEAAVRIDSIVTKIGWEADPPISFLFTTCVIVCPAVVCVIYLAGRLHDKATHRDHSVCPFYTREEYEAALASQQSTPNL